MTDQFRNLVLPPVLICVGGFCSAFAWLHWDENILPQLDTSPFEFPERVQLPSDQFFDLEVSTPVSPQEIVSVSIFLRDRQPWVTPQEKIAEPTSDLESVTTVEPKVDEMEPAEAPPHDHLSMVGYTRIGEKPRALLLSHRTNEEVWISMAQLIDGWTVVEIRPSEVVLRFNKIEVLVKYDR